MPSLSERTIESKTLREIGERLPVWLRGSAWTYWWFLANNDPNRPAEGEIWKSFSGWMFEINQGAQGDEKTLKEVLFFAAYPYRIDFSLAIAGVMTRFGCNVDFAWLPGVPGTPSEPWLSQLLWRKRFTKWIADFRAVGKYPRLNPIFLKDVQPSEITQGLTEIASEQSYFDTQNAHRVENVDLVSNAKHRETYEYRFMRNLDCIARLQSLLSAKPYDFAIVPNGVGYEFGAAYRLMRKDSVPCTTLEHTDRRGTVQISHSEPCINIVTGDAWTADEPHILTPARIERARSILKVREAPSPSNYFLKQQSTPRGTTERIQSLLSVDSQKPIALMCPNIAWDAAVLVARRAFSSMAQWIVDTILFFAKRPDWQLIVRPHPMEKFYGSVETTAKAVWRSFHQLPGNVRLIPPDAQINTYDIADLSKFCLVYTGSIGLELAARGLPVIVAGRAHYSDKGFTLDANSTEEYFSILSHVLKDPDGSRLNTRQLELAFSYVDVYFNRWEWPFPWNATTFADDLTEWPPGKVVSKEGRDKFGPTFEYLVRARAGGLASRLSSHDEE